MDEQLLKDDVDAWKRLTLASGITSIIFGLVLLIWPGETLLVFTALLGIVLALLGLVRLFGAFTTRGLSGGQRVWRLLAGAALLILGIFVLVNAEASIRFLMVVIGIMWLIAGLSEIISGFGEGREHRIGTIALGILSLIFGVVALVWPGPTLTVIIWISGLWLIFAGLLQIWVGWRMSKLRPVEIRANV